MSGENTQREKQSYLNDPFSGGAIATSRGKLRRRDARARERNNESKER